MNMMSCVWQWRWWRWTHC